LKRRTPSLALPAASERLEGPLVRRNHAALKIGAAGNEKVRLEANGNQYILPEACPVNQLFARNHRMAWLEEKWMRSVTMHEAKTHLSKLIEEALEGEEVLIFRGAVPVARLVPIGESKGPVRFEGSSR